MSESNIADTAEQILLRRAESLARVTVEERAEEATSVLLFRIAEEWYAIRVADVREIFQEYELTAIPCLPPYVLGVVNVRGEILSVTDPALLMQLGSVFTGEGSQPPAIVITDGDVATALVVDEVGDIAEVGSDMIEGPISTIDRAQGAFISASLCVDDVMVGLMNTARVLEPIVVGPKH
jgi:purine-binding chemotaxis protein CheW